VSFFFDSGACRTANCIDPNPIVDNYTVRTNVVVQKVIPFGTGAGAAVACATGGGSYTSPDCYYNLPFANITNWNITHDFNIYTQKSAPVPAPIFYLHAPPVITPANTYPNYQGEDAITALIDFTGQPSEQTIRYAWIRYENGPCYYDYSINRVVCSAAGVSSANTQYWDVNQNLLPSTAIWATTNCPAV
jgi:hypothetical protein